MGKGSAPLTSGESTRGLWILLGAVAVVFVGVGIAAVTGVFTGTGGGNHCEQSLTGGVIHEHAVVYLYLDDSGRPFDFSPQRYQVQETFVHFEDGARDANGGDIHQHQVRPSLGCLFESIRWQVGPEGLRTDDGFYAENATHGFTIEITGLDGEEKTWTRPWWEYQPRGTGNPRQGDVIVVRYGPRAADA